MIVKEEVLLEQDTWAQNILDKIIREENVSPKSSNNTFVDCFFGCSGSCTGCEGTSHCANGQMD